MKTELRITTKGFPTLLTFIGFLTSMNTLMLSQVWGSSEGFPTFLTFIGLLWRKTSWMLRYVAMLVENWHFVICDHPLPEIFPLIFLLLFQLAFDFQIISGIGLRKSTGFKPVTHFPLTYFCFTNVFYWR
jgi:hypothetical protein